MRLWTLGSGSKGNALLIECGDTRVLVDAGFSARRIGERLAAIGVDPRSITGLLLTHEHRDHLCGVASVVKRWSWPVHLTAGTAVAAGDALSGATTRVVAPGAAFEIGSLTLTPVRTSHDAAKFVQVAAKAMARRHVTLGEKGRRQLLRAHAARWSA